jgi:hypothetical protein
MKSLKMVLLCSVASLLFWCGGPSKPPEIISREIPSLGNTRTDAGIPVDLNNKPDASVVFYDAGVCCPVNVAIAVRGDETLAYVREFSSGTRVMLTKFDGAWRGSFCFDLASEKSLFYYQLGFALDDADAGITDAGEYLIDTVNRATPTEGLAAVGEVNVFQSQIGLACAAQDAGLYAQLFDAGVIVEDGGP